MDVQEKNESLRGLKFALAQLEVLPGMPEKNVQNMLESIHEAKQARVDLIAFPELCVPGYFLSDRWVEDAFCEELMHYNEVLLGASRDIALVYGNIFLDKNINQGPGREGYHPNKDGRTRKYNAAYVMQNGNYAPRAMPTPLLPEGVQPKTLLPSYRIFDDERYFFSLQDAAKDGNIPLSSLASPFMLNLRGKSVKVGVEICEDLWCKDYRVNGQALNVTRMLVSHGAELIINISASPWNFGKNEARHKRVRFLREDTGNAFVPFFYVNQVGAQNNGKNIITLDGDSTVYNRSGEPVLAAKKPFTGELMIFEAGVLGQKSMPIKKAYKTKQKFDAIIKGLHHLGLIAGHTPSFVIGLSGGIDSAVVAALLVHAFGKQQLLAVNMPTKYNTEKTKNAAKRVAENLDIEYLVIPVDELHEMNSRIFSGLDKKFNPNNAQRELSDENIQAKIRGTNILSNIAGRYGRFMVNNGNKLEIALGYATLYGDVNGAVSPIGDLTKTEVYELGRFLNEEIFKEEIIPSILFPGALFRFSDEKISPSAELRSDQVDPMKFGYHCALLDAFTSFIRKSPEDVMRWFLDGTLEESLGISAELIRRWGVDDARVFTEDLEWFASSIQRAVFKRVQAPPVIITGSSAYGYDIRESMLPFVPSRRFKELKEKVLKKGKYI